MKEKQQDNTNKVHAVSPLVADKTYGERMYNNVFEKGLNFWANLLTSAAFSLYAANSASKVRLPFMKEASTPHGIQQALAGKIDKYLLKPFIKDETVRGKRAFAVAEVQTLLIPGHIIMIPSIWLGAKIKPAFVRYFDKKHYGEHAEEDPSIKYRHELIDAEAKPTLAGAVVGRLGTMTTTTVAGSLIGSRDNFVNKIGKSRNIEPLKEFAINPAARQIGEVIGGGAVEKIGAISKVNDRLSNKLVWSHEQLKNFNEKGIAAPEKYNQGIQDYTGFVAMDTLYTLITASVIHPIMSALRSVPGMTYTTRPPVEKKLTTDTGDTTKLRVPRNRMAFAPDAVAEAPAPAAARESYNEASPKINAGEIKHLDRIHSNEHEMSAG